MSELASLMHIYIHSYDHARPLGAGAAGLQWQTHPGDHRVGVQSRPQDVPTNHSSWSDSFLSIFLFSSRGVCVCIAWIRMYMS